MKQIPEKKWQRWIPWIVTCTMVAWVISGLRAPKNKTAYQVEEFAKIPVLLEGRVQPLDSVARNSLLMLRGKAKVIVTEQPQEELGFFQLAKAPKMQPAEWLLEALSRPDKADTRHIFRIDNGEVLSMLKLSPERKYFSFNDLKEGWPEIEKQARRIRDQKIPEQVQTPFEKQIVKVQFALGLYFRIKNSVRPESVADFTEEVRAFEGSIAPGLAAFRKQQAKEEHKEEDLQAMAYFFKRYEMLSGVGYPLIVPPDDAEKSRDGWKTVGASLMESVRTGKIHPAIWSFAKLVDTYGREDVAGFNAAVAEYKASLDSKFAAELKKGAQENFFNQYAPFVKSISIYLLAFLFGCAYWINWAPWTRRTAFFLLLVGVIIHTSGLIFRMYLEGRPPVTNLYSSAIFVGWGAVVLGIILERIWKDAIGGVTAAAVGVTTLIIAHNLSLGGDTMKMLQAVLDTNFWLATHVVVITLGYASMFVAGFLAIVYVVRGFFTKTLIPATSRALARMVYGIVCFATLFSFCGDDPGRNLGRSILGPVLGLGPEGKRRSADCYLVRSGASRSVGRNHSRKRADGNGDFRKCDYCILLVRRQYARRRFALLRLYGRRLPVADRISDQSIVDHWLDDDPAPLLEEFQSCRNQTRPGTTRPGRREARRGLAVTM
jgi:hypothetical protein